MNKKIDKKQLLEVASVGLWVLSFAIGLLSDKVSAKQNDMQLKEEVAKAVAEQLGKSES